MTSGNGTRPAWESIPEAVRADIDGMLGSPVVAARSQAGGFSPGTADRVTLADGRRAFVKAVSAAVNPHSIDMHRREAGIVARLPAGLPVPRFHGIVDRDGWVALVFDEVTGRPPLVPWREDEIDATLEALARVAATSAAGLDLPRFDDALGSDFLGWQRLSVDPWPDLPAVATTHLPELTQLARAGLAASAGDRLVHCDIRADNLLVAPDGGVSVVDWPWACAGAWWIDPLSLVVNVAVQGGDADALLASHPLLRNIPAADVDGFLAGLAGFFLDYGRLPPPPGIPKVREFQHLQGVAVLVLLARRRRWS